MAKPYVRLDKSDAAVLLVDHQTGLLSQRTTPRLA